MGLVIIGVILKKLKWKKLLNGFTSQIRILNFDKLNFCFRNSNYEWDNNYNHNFTCPIEKEEAKIEIEENFIINEENIVTDILNNLFENDISEVKDTKIEINKEENTITTAEATETNILENTVNNIEINEKSILENTFSDVETDKTENITTTVDVEETISNNIEVASTENTETENINNFEIDTVNIAEIENGLEKDIENIFNDLYEGTSKIFEASTPATTIKNIEAKVKENHENKKFDMDGLINEILAPIAESSSFENITSHSEEVIDNGLIDNILSEDSEVTEITETINENSDSTLNSSKFEEAPLIDVIEPTNTDTSLVKVDTLDDYLVSARSLSKFYILKKRIKFALYKLFVAVPKIISHALSEDED